MKDVGAAVEYDLLDTGGLGALGDHPADLGRGGLVGAGLELALQVLVEARGGRQRAALSIIDDLGVDVLGGAEHRKARTPCGDLLQRGPYPTLAALSARLVRGSHGPLLLLAFLAEDRLGGIFHALALVGLGR